MVNRERWNHLILLILRFFGNDTTLSCSELDSDPDQDFCGRKSVAAVPNLDSQPRGRARTRGGNTST